ncbi:hypothetical protein [Loigolactobacillus bifermentans]|jgi:hypothetical protein|uniref:Uncharacterized protein n=1 Tax=Loigolactobacillus bifermentans DSM 20003 TaxID=1423726 RepID=A0A0R1GN83_9LACO|nr:hypothetical protein [Loigolactobacillus bifermentans]KRK35376.1 hypothetical protein FC07_GL000103 [Loigolactobacillus bifermentans DSM 20003]QGG60365.1 hypothetical protein LB003_07790 [Loigolactobacillus bifermentans]
MTTKTELQQHLALVDSKAFCSSMLVHDTFRACLHRSAVNLGFIEQDRLTPAGHQYLKKNIQPL